MRVTYVNSAEHYDSEEEFLRAFPHMAGRELIWFDFLSIVSWKDNSIATQEWLKSIGREDLIREVENEPNN